jgi:SAM-dependent methyltransferase
MILWPGAQPGHVARTAAPSEVRISLHATTEKDGAPVTGTPADVSGQAGPCRACGATDLLSLGRCRPYGETAMASARAALLDPPDPGTLYRCRACGLGQRVPLAARAWTEENYRALPAGLMQYAWAANTAWKTAERVLRGELAGGRRSVLDVGCYDGQFLRSLPAEWRRFGIEPSPAAAAVARASGIEVVAGSLEDLVELAAPENRGLDAVCLFDVVEHVPDPRQQLELALTLLRPGGLLVVGTGDMDAWTWRWSGSQHWYLETPEHVSFASRRFFRWFAGRTGAALERLSRVPHQRGTWRERVDDAIDVLYVGSLGRGPAWRLARGVIRRFPRWRGLVHRTAITHAAHLRDHIIVVMRKPAP